MPTFAAIFALVLLAGLSLWWCNSFLDDTDVVNAKLSGALASFLDKERQRESHPSILVAGSSVNCYGICLAPLEKRFGTSAGKIALGGCGIWECERILKKYPQETQSVKIVYIDLRMICLGTAIGSQIANAFPRLHDFSDVRDVRLYESLHKTGVVPATRLDLCISDMLPHRMSFHNLKTYLKKLKSKNSETPCGFENMWTFPGRIEYSKPIIEELSLYATDATYEPQNKNTQDLLKFQSAICSRYNTEIESWLWDFARYCEGRGIFVVFNITPCWRAIPYIPDRNDPNLTIDQKKYLALFDKLDAHTNCRVIVLKDFQTLIPGAVDAEYLFDTHHMTKNGATVYTHWLADQTLRDEKICAHLGIPCQADVQTDFIKLVAELGMTVPQSETQSSETRVAETGATVK
ncbi:MAG: hypothetical protein ACRC46_02000 [Thermoguttaceae bacterium]